MVLGWLTDETFFFRNLNKWSDKSLRKAAAEEFGENPGGFLRHIKGARGKRAEVT